MGSKLPKRVLRMKGKTMKQKWALHKRGGGKKARTKARKAYKRSYRSTLGGPVPRKKAWGIGRYINAFRNIDILSASAQGTLAHGGDTKYKLTDLKARYMSGAYKYNTWKGIGVGLGSNIIKSKAGVYRGAGKGKILSVLQAASPELLAMKDVDPTKDFKRYNAHRHIYMSGYDPWGDKQSFSLNDDIGKRFWEDKMFNFGLGLIQKIVFDTNGPIKLNARLPKGVNF